MSTSQGRPYGFFQKALKGGNVLAAVAAAIALTGAGYREAAETLKAMAETATRRRRERGVA